MAVILMVLGIAAGLFLRGRHFAAGCVLSLCLIKYNLFLTLPLLICGKRLWKLGGGVLAGGAALLALSFAAGGWSWPSKYLAELRLPVTTPSYAGMPNLHGLFGRQGILVEIAAACLTLAVVWLVVRGGDVARGFAAMLAGGLLVSYHAFPGDDAILIPVSLYLLGRAPDLPGKLAGILLLCPLTYLPFAMSNPPFPPAAPMLLPLAAMAGRRVQADLQRFFHRGDAETQRKTEKNREKQKSKLESAEGAEVSVEASGSVDSPNRPGRT